MAHRQVVGRWGEKIAAAYMEERGYSLIDKNARTKYGELDLIMQNGEIVVFVEVKARTSESFGLPEISVNKVKQKHLVQSAEAYLMEHPELGQHWRIDVIAVQNNQGQEDPSIEWFENAVSG